MTENDKIQTIAASLALQATLGAILDELAAERPGLREAVKARALELLDTERRVVDVGGVGLPPEMALQTARDRAKQMVALLSEVSK